MNLGKSIGCLTERSFKSISSKPELINYRWRYIRAVLRQDTSWYDKQNVEGIPTTIHKNLREVEVASGRTVAFILYSLGSVMSGAGITFGAGWVF